MSYPCGVCDKETTGTRCLLCRSCDVWYHAECESVSKVLFSTLDKNRNLAYTCAACVENPPDNSDNAFKMEMRKEFAAIKDSHRTLADDMKTVVGEIRAELANGLKEIKDDVLNCRTLISSHDMANKKKFYDLELQNHVLQHRLNRSDIVITGLSDKLADLNAIVKGLGAYLKVEIIPADISNVMYIRNRRAILVKFVEVSKRDKLMSAYYKSKSLKVSDVIDVIDDKRVYMNDNYSTLANKLLKLCWKLKNDKKINGYSIINREVLKTKIIMLNGEVKIANIQECTDLFHLNS